MRNKLLRRIASFVIALAMLLPTIAAVNADENQSDATAADTEASTDSDTGDSSSSSSGVVETSAQVIDELNRSRTYSTFYDNHIDDPRPDREYIINGSDYTYASEDSGAYVDTLDGLEALVWENESGAVEFPVTIEEAGLYNIGLTYYVLASVANDVEFSLLIDGESPYSTADRIVLSKVWEDEEGSYSVNEAGEKVFKTDENGNQIRPTLEECLMWQTQPLKDTDGLFNDPLLFYFEEGEHTIRIESQKAKFAINQIRIYNKQPTPAAADVDTITTDVNEASETSGVRIPLQGETADYRSDITLYATYDRTTYVTSPSDPVKMFYNTIGSENWAASGQTITWKFTMDEAGWVKIGIRGKQNQMRGLYSNRRLYIDGEVPCAEAEAVKFYYSENWQCVTPTDADGNTLYFWLEAGEHELALEAVPGEIGDIMRRLDDLVFYLNSYYRQILQITSPTPDEYNTYMIDKQIPSIIPDFEIYAQDLRDIKAEIETLSGTTGTEAVSLETMAQLLDKCIDRPDDIPSMLGQLKDDITSLSQWMTDYRSQYLEVDMIEITSADVEFSSVKENFFKSLSFDFQAFLGSFFTDYNVLSGENKDALNVWVSLGRDQAQIVKELVDSYFVPETGIQTSINLVQGGILEATLAGKGPDVALFIGGDLPIQLAARDCIVDISQYDDYEEVITRFAPNIMTLYTYQDGVYGLPISQTFSMMFYRSDVLQSFGFTDVPEDWDQLIEMLPTLQRSYMGVGFSFDVFGTFMVQRGLNYYNDTKTATIFEDPLAVDAFETWTKFYTTYSFEQTFDAFSRFRTGEYPIIITGYTFYNQLYMAAPEIRGLWDFDLIPGYRNADGTVNHATTSSSAGGIIFSKLNEEQRADAWELLKWFTSTDIQSEYGRSIEALLGPLGRFDTANMEALRQLAWSRSEADLIIEQMMATVEIDIIPATYIVTRSITNAFRETVNLNKNPRDTFLWFNRDINDEIIRKYEELGIEIPTEDDN